MNTICGRNATTYRVHGFLLLFNTRHGIQVIFFNTLQYKNRLYYECRYENISKIMNNKKYHYYSLFLFAAGCIDESDACRL